MAHNMNTLGQVRPANSTAVSIYSPPASTDTSLVIHVANTTAAVAKCRIFVDDNGTTYDETTALAWDTEIQPGETLTFPAGDKYHMNDATGNIAVRTDTANALTFTASGHEVTA